MEPGRPTAADIPLLLSSLDEGIKVVLLDFVGHGKTGGAMSEGSLSLRIDHAYEIIKRYTDDNAPLILCGFSMSGHVALRLLPKLGSRVQNLGLFCPAVYAAEAEDVHFGPEFTKILRTPESWRSSIALQNAARYKNRALLVIGSNDQTIPWRVVEAITASLKQSASHVQLEVIGGADHQLAKWLSDHPKTSKQIAHHLTTTATSEHYHGLCYK